MKLKWNLEAGQYLPLREVVFHTLRDAILTGQLQPGERLMEIQLAQTLGVSRTPVREAIHKLELEGLVVTTPRKGAEVASITEKQLRDVLEVRTALETLAVRLACKRVTQEQLDELEQAQAYVTEMIREENLVGIVNADIRFHEIVYIAADNERLLQILNNLRQQMYRYRLEYLKNSDNHEIIIKEHKAIVDGMRALDEEKVSKAMREHIINQENAVISMIGKDKKQKKE